MVCGCLGESLTFNSPAATLKASSMTEPTAMRTAADECISFHTVSLSTCRGQHTVQTRANTNTGRPARKRESHPYSSTGKNSVHLLANRTWNENQPELRLQEVLDTFITSGNNNNRQTVKWVRHPHRQQPNTGWKDHNWVVRTHTQSSRHLNVINLYVITNDVSWVKYSVTHCWVLSLFTVRMLWHSCLIFLSGVTVRIIHLGVWLMYYFISKN